MVLTRSPVDQNALRTCIFVNQVRRYTYTSFYFIEPQPTGRERISFFATRRTSLSCGLPMPGICAKNDVITTSKLRFSNCEGFADMLEVKQQTLFSETCSFPEFFVRSSTQSCSVRTKQKWPRRQTIDQSYSNGKHRNWYPSPPVISSSWYPWDFTGSFFARKVW